MAGAVVGGAFLSASLQVLFDRLASREFISFFSKPKLDDGLRDKLETSLLALQAVLDDAEDKQITNKSVKDWIDKLQHVVYQADDLLDEIATKAMRDRLEDDHDQSVTQSSTTQVRFLRFLSLIKPSRINQSVSTPVYLSDEEIESRMKGINRELERFVEQKKTLKLKDYVGRKQLQRLPTASLVYESEVCGRKDDKEKIIELLLSGNASGNEIPVIPIVGMGGIGKTTLAQFVYNDVRVNENFPMKSWVCVADAFDISMITKKILDDITSLDNNINSLDQLQTKLKESVARKKFLIVLDDVWNDNYIDWDLLKRPFRAGAHASRIIVTTRINNVASVMGTVPSHLLEQLPFEDCWSLFVKHAFVNKDYTTYPELESIGIEIVKKCGGLPLAVKSLGGLLRSKLEIGEWKNIFKSEIWDLDRSVPPALRLSYHYLPSHLKRCFAFCSIFPKDYKFEKKKLVLLWIALDLVQQSKNNKSVEDEGNDYFHELLSRSFFQRLSHDTNYDFLMHDLIHDLAQDISGEFCFRLDYDKPLDHICGKVRHFSYVKGKYDAFEKFKAINEGEYLRTFISFSKVWNSFLGNKVLHDLLPNLRCLRVLSLSHYQISELPESIKNLIHLRYLDLSGTKIEQLPDLVTTLCNLQVLDLSYCKYLTKLPMHMGKLIKLRHLDIRETKLTEMPTQMRRLKDLQHLTCFVVGENSGSRIRELKELCHLRGKLSILGLENVVSGQDALEANMMDKRHLEGLVMKWGGDADDSQKERDVLDKLQPHEGVKTLSIFNYGSTKFPDWLERVHSFRNMVTLNLIKCANCYSLPSIGQLPSLKNLRIQEMKAITEVGREFYGDASSVKPFQSLERLWFEGMSHWEEWHALGVGEFSCLLELSLVDCPKLTNELSIPFPSLRKLEISKCQRLVSNQVGLLLQGLPSLQELKMSKMTNLTELPLQLQYLSSLQELMMADIPNLTELPRQLQNLSSLQKLIISNIPNLTELPPQLQNLSSLQKLEISRMQNLKELPLETCRLMKVERMEIKKCPSLVSLSDAGLPPMLKALKISECKALQTIKVASAEGMNMNMMMGINNICLEELCISNCSSLLQVSFLIGGLPPLTLRTLDISNCRSLEFPLLSEEETNHHMTCSIEVLNITRTCDLLKSLSLGFFPKLRFLEIRGCMNFETLSIPDEEFQNLMEFRIRDCPRMVSFAQEGLRAPNLTSFYVGNCENLKSLPQRMHTLLPSLERLSIYNCPEVESFPDGGLPSNLHRLDIVGNCEKLMTGRMGWGLQRTLPSLREIDIGGEYDEEELETFPEEWLLPTTLTNLGIEGLQNLKSLNHKGLQHLTSLQRLYITNCPKLQSLPEEGLPNSLSYLCIRDCPLLKPRCQREKGEDWPTISRVRHIRIDLSEVIINLE